MRFHRFEFSHYAGFEQRQLRFSPDARLHLIVGSNEAGKSRLMRAMARFLFGFPQRDTDQFGFDGAKSCLKAKLEIEGELYRLSRSRKRSAPLVDEATGEASLILSQSLGNLTADQFLQHQALSHDALRLGGDALMAGQGELGSSLFAAGSEVRDVNDFIHDLRSQAEALFKPSANTKKAQINQALNQLDALKKQRAAAEFKRPAFNALTAEISNAQTRIQTLETRRAGLNQQLNEKDAEAKLLARQEQLEAQLKEEQEQSATFASEIQNALQSLKIDEALFANLDPQLETLLQDYYSQLRDQVTALDMAKRNLSDQPQDQSAESLPNLEEVFDVPDVKALVAEHNRKQRLWEEAAGQVQTLSHQLDLPDVPLEQSLQAPDGDVLQNLAIRQQELEVQQKNDEEKLNKLKEEQLGVKETKDKLKSISPSADPERLISLRDQRDQTLSEALIRTASQDGAGTARALTDLQVLLAKIDKTVDDRLLHADQVSALEQALERGKVLSFEVERQMAQSQETDSQLFEIEEAWSRAWQDAGLNPVGRARYNRWMQAFASLENAKARMLEADIDCQNCVRRLNEAKDRLDALYGSWTKKIPLSLQTDTEDLSSSGASALGDEDRAIAQAEQLKHWAEQLSELKSQRRARQEFEKAVLTQAQALDEQLSDLNAELVAHGLPIAKTIGIALERLKALIACFDLQQSQSKAHSKIVNYKSESQELQSTLATLQQDVPSGESIHAEDLRNELQDVQKEISDAQHALAEREADLSNRLASFDSLKLDNQIAVLEAEILELVELYQLSLASSSALQFNLERFVKQKSADLIERISGLFSALTSGDYKRLFVEDQNGSKFWWAETAEGREVPFLGFSEGTKDPLFLAMRLAFLQETSLPFIADDLFINFDDKRSEAAFATVVDALPNAQCFYFSHHRHMADVAREAIGAEKLDLIDLDTF